MSPAPAHQFLSLFFLFVTFSLYQQLFLFLKRIHKYTRFLFRVCFTFCNRTFCFVICNESHRYTICAWELFTQHLAVVSVYLSRAQADITVHALLGCWVQQKKSRRDESENGKGLAAIGLEALVRANFFEIIGIRDCLVRRMERLVNSYIGLFQKGEAKKALGSVALKKAIKVLSKKLKIRNKKEKSSCKEHKVTGETLLATRQMVFRNFFSFSSFSHSLFLFLLFLLIFFVPTLSCMLRSHALIVHGCIGEAALPLLFFPNQLPSFLGRSSFTPELLCNRGMLSLDAFLFLVCVAFPWRFCRSSLLYFCIFFLPHYTCCMFTHAIKPVFRRSFLLRRICQQPTFVLEKKMLKGQNSNGLLWPVL